VSGLLRAFDGPLTRALARGDGPLGLGQLPLALVPEATTTTVCGYCSTGCGLDLHLRGNVAVNLTPARAYPVNRGSACAKGWEALRATDATDRATRPLLREDRSRAFRPVDWPTALATFVARMREIRRERGPDAVAFLGTGQITTEELALLGAVAKIGMGIVHGDSNTRQCMATSVAAYKESFGFDAPPYTYADLEETDVAVLVGSNLAVAHPILWERLVRSPRRPTIVVVDPRRTETAAAAALHLPLRPKSDLVLLYGIARWLVHHGGVDEAFVARSTSGFEELAAFVERFTPDVVARSSGIDERTLERTAALVRDGGRVSFWWTMGVNQSHEGTRTAQAIIDLALLTGNVGRPGTGANSVTGQCNAMGSRLFSNTASLYGGRDFTKPADRAAVAEILGVDPARIPATRGLAYDQIVDGIADGRIRGLWIVATNAAHSWIGQADFLELLGRLDFLVVQDMYASTETARLADLVLPAAGWGEKEGTFINSERRIGLVKKARRAPGEALSDFAIFKLVAEAWGCGETFREWSSPEAVFRILKRLSRGTPCDVSGIADYAAIDAAGGIQWPFPAAGTTVPGRERRLFEDGRFFHPDGRARFVFDEPRPLPEAPNRKYPLLLLTGRASVTQWHTETRTAKSPVLRKLSPRELHVEIHPEDAARAGVEHGGRVTVESPRGRIHARAFVTATVGVGRVFVPMHDATTNRLTDPAFDPWSRQPAYKSCAVSVRPVPTLEASS
jgi:anaerobic selenocysteine-containing dehydrogenase